MQAVELPLVASKTYEGVVYLLFPGFDERNCQGVQYELYPEQGLVYVYCFEEGFEESGDAEGVAYPVAVHEDDATLISELSTLRVIDPEALDPDAFDDGNEYERIMERYERFRDNA